MAVEESEALDVLIEVESEQVDCRLLGDFHLLAMMVTLTGFELGECLEQAQQALVVDRLERLEGLMGVLSPCLFGLVEGLLVFV
jgi:hypothetical protein